MTKAERNAAFLRNIFLKGPSEGHGFICKPDYPSMWSTGLGDYTNSDRPVTDWVPSIVTHYEAQVRFLEDLDDHSVPKATLGCGTQLYAAAFGCPVHEYEDSNPCALPIVRTAREADAIEEPDLWSCPSLYRVFELAEALQRELGKDVPLGPPDLQSGFDTASLVWNKQDMLVAMATDPEPVRRLVGKCANLFRKFLIALRAELPSMSPGHCPRAWVPPDMPPWLSNDECGAFSTAMFEEFCLPELTELAETFGGLGMHCCADAEHQFESFKKIPNLYAFNRVPGRQGWDPLLEHFDGPDSPVHVLGWVTPAQIEAFIRKAHPATRFIFVHNVPTLEAGQQWMDQVAPLRGA